MDLIQIVVLAVVQGITEFLPISSSAHLILVPVLSGWQDQGLAFDVAVHLGSLAAVVWYFRRDLNAMTSDWLRSVQRRQLVGESRLAWAVLWGTVPAGLAGLLLHDFIETQLRSPLVIAWATIGFGVLLWIADRHGRRRRSEASLTWMDVLVIGVAQALALIPGTSRSGITMTAGLMMGLTREAAARFSFLLAIPLILMASAYQSVSLARSTVSVDWAAFILGIVLSAVSAYVCIHYFLKLIQRIGMFPFVVYRLLLGALLLVVFA
ncbi:MAG: undecaprenyl-diphosphate phosphatase [Pseudomonadota bacterium]|nr:MAG: undecaprenyl-diphosphate phosphatase [Pseudomonadota bacterium]